MYDVAVAAGDVPVLVEDHYCCSNYLGLVADSEVVLADWKAALFGPLVGLGIWQLSHPCQDAGTPLSHIFS